jgi:hypothetical protein
MMFALPDIEYSITSQHIDFPKPVNRYKIRGKARSMFGPPYAAFNLAVCQFAAANGVHNSGCGVFVCAAPVMVLSPIDDGDTHQNPSTKSRTRTTKCHRDVIALFCGIRLRCLPDGSK